MQAGLALGAIAWGAYQLASKIRQKVGEGNKLGSAAVVKEIAITLTTSTISFLTGGVAEAIPGVLGFAEGVSNLVSEGTQFGTAEAASMLEGEAEALDVGTAVDAASLLRDLVECCKGKTTRTSATCSCTDENRIATGATMRMKDVGDSEKPQNTAENLIVTDEFVL